MKGSVAGSSELARSLLAMAVDFEETRRHLRAVDAAGEAAECDCELIVEGVARTLSAHHGTARPPG